MFRYMLKSRDLRRCVVTYHVTETQLDKGNTPDCLTGNRDADDHYELPY